MKMSDTPNPLPGRDSGEDEESYREVVTHVATEAHAHSLENRPDIGLVEAVKTFAQWAETAQPSCREWGQQDAFYAHVYLYAREIAEIAHHHLLSNQAQVEGTHPAWELEERLKAFLDAYRGDALRGESRL
jgi:hypothetical protein